MKSKLVRKISSCLTILMIFPSLVFRHLSCPDLLKCPWKLRPKMQNCSRDGLRDNLPGQVLHKLREGVQARVFPAVLNRLRGGVL